MNEQERINAMKRQRQIADRKAREADGSLEEERRRVREHRIRVEMQKRQQRQAMQKLLGLAVLLIAVVVLLITGITKAVSSVNSRKNQQSSAAAQSEEQSQSAAQSAEESAEQSAAQSAAQSEAQSQSAEQSAAQSVAQSEEQSQSAAQSVAHSAEESAAQSAAIPAAADPSAVQQVIDPSGIVIPSWITVDLIHINEVSRPAIALDTVHDIAIHYVGNATSSAKANRDYFDSLDNPAVVGAGRQASAHLIVGLEGEVVQCLPLNEMAYAVRSRNPDTISIEVCHPDETGKFSDVTYATLVKLTAWLLQQKGLTPDHVIRHYDCDGKYCPLYYVEHEDAWAQLKQDIADYYYANPNIQ